jgi:phospholipase/carboxylesterase
LALAVLAAMLPTRLNAQQTGGTVHHREIRLQDSRLHPYILITPAVSQTNRCPLFVFLHGQCAPLEEVLTSHESTLKRQNCYILLPQAPDDCGDGGYSWYDKSNLKTLETGLERDERLLKEMISDLTRVENVDPAKVTLCGFSSGARVAFFVGFRNPRMFSEIVPISGFYMPQLLDPLIGDLNGLKVSIYHGTQDDVNPFRDMQRAYQHLRDRGVRVTLTTYPLGHRCPDEILGRILDNVR